MLTPGEDVGRFVVVRRLDPLGRRWLLRHRVLGTSVHAEILQDLLDPTAAVRRQAALTAPFWVRASDLDVLRGVPVALSPWQACCTVHDLMQRFGVADLAGVRAPLVRLLTDLEASGEVHGSLEPDTLALVEEPPGELSVVVYGAELQHAPTATDAVRLGAWLEGLPEGPLSPDLLGWLREASTHTESEPTSLLHTSSLPAWTGPFVGRVHEISVVQGLLDRAGLVALVGPGGSGKTRLACEVAHRNPTPSCLAHQPGDAPHAVMAMLGMKGASEEDVMRAAPFAGRRLLILDDVHRMGAGDLRFLGDLARGSGIQVLLTSREPQDLGEVVTVAGLSEEDAEILFRRQSGRFDSDPAVTVLLEEVGRLPQSIELLAARARVLPPVQLLDRMDQRFRLLQRRGSVSVEAVLESTWTGLPPEERAMLGQLAAFAGPVPTEHADAFLELDGGWAFEVAETLAERGLLDVRSGSYALSPTLVAYVKAHEPAAIEAARSRHADLVLGLTERILHGESVHWPRFDREQRVALERLLEGRDPRSALVACALTPARLDAGDLQEHGELLARVAEAGGAPLDIAIARALCDEAASWTYDGVAALESLDGWRGSIVRMLASRRDQLTGDLDGAARHAQASLALAGPAWSHRRAHHTWVRLLVSQNRASQALVELDREGSDDLQSRIMRHTILVALHRHAEAVALCRENIRLARRLGDARTEAEALIQLAVATADPDLLHPALQIARRIGDRRLELYAVANLTSVALECGRSAGTPEHAESVMTDLRTLAGDIVAASFAVTVGTLHLERGDPTRGRELLELAVDTLSVRPGNAFVAYAVAILSLQEPSGSEAGLRWIERVQVEAVAEVRARRALLAAAWRADPRGRARIESFWSADLERTEGPGQPLDRAVWMLHLAEMAEGPDRVQALREALDLGVERSAIGRAWLRGAPELATLTETLRQSDA